MIRVARHILRSEDDAVAAAAISECYHGTANQFWVGTWRTLAGMDTFERYGQVRPAMPMGWVGTFYSGLRRYQIKPSARVGVCRH